MVSVSMDGTVNVQLGDRRGHQMGNAAARRQPRFLRHCNAYRDANLRTGMGESPAKHAEKKTRLGTNECHRHIAISYDARKNTRADGKGLHRLHQAQGPLCRDCHAHAVFGDAPRHFTRARQHRRDEGRRGLRHSDFALQHADYLRLELQRVSRGGENVVAAENRACHSRIGMDEQIPDSPPLRDDLR